MFEHDLELSALAMFTGTERYYNVFGFMVTDGIKYLMDNGYSWFVTDALAVIRYRYISADFLIIRLANLRDNECDLLIENDDGIVLYRQHYKYTNARRELKLYYVDGVLMLPTEY